MGDFMQHAAGVMKKYADQIALIDDKREMTYGELDEASGKIYGWLKGQGIGREDFVQLVMPRGVTGLVAMMGVWKAGAALVISEQGYPAHRLEFIHQDTGAKALIDEIAYNRIMSEEKMLEGFEETAPHDAALAIYTSGSTGNPKGILHEYGNLDLIALYEERRHEYHDEPVALLTPFSFVATIIYTVNFFNYLRPLLIVSAELLRDFARLQAVFKEKKVYNFFVTPSYLRMYKDPSPYLDYIVIGGESASGIYYEGGSPRVRILYSLSEAGFCVLQKELDRSYDNAPLGKPVIESLDLHLEDEEGNRIEGPGEGEICFKNVYMREYMHLPEKTAEAFRGGYFHTGDLARREADGMYYYMGRSDDMFKINGNRVEPGEIESAFRKLTRLDTVMAKCFEEKGRSYICLYYLEGEAEAAGIFKEADSKQSRHAPESALAHPCASGELTVSLAPLADILPHYMLPTYYVPLEKMPTNAHGKIVRRLLEPPKVDAGSQNYVAPVGEAEKDLCQIMAEVLELGVEDFGAEHDFYLLGGDSLGTIRLIALAGERGWTFSAADLYKARTPRKLAPLMKKAAADMEERERKARQKDMPLLQLMCLWQDRLGTELNYPIARVQTLLKLKESVELDRFLQAVDQVYRHHPILLTRLVETKSGSFVQRYDQELFAPTEAEEVTEAEMWELVQGGGYAFDMAKGLLHHRRIFKTEQGIYFYMLFHHVLMDGTGLQVIRDNICRAYEGEELPPDYYYYLLEQEFSEDREAVLREYEEKYGLENCSGLLAPDLPGPDASPQVLTETFPRHDDDENLCHLAAAAMAAARCNGEDRAAIYWTYNGRDDYLRSNSAGGFVKYLPLQLEVEPGASPALIKARVQAQTAFTLSHNRAFQGGLFKDNSTVNSLIYLYQKDIFSLGKIAALAEEVPIPADHSQPMGVLLLTLVDTESAEKLTRQFVYSGGFYSEAKAENFVRYLRESLAYLGG
ncbi:AMP-binding protein [Selenomonas sp. KH1T6]|uniref:AMP-binding protein n=1 Tax=Selenomonas sp. KH1T6 TaxID=3158784 RepID=UPI00094533A3